MVKYIGLSTKIKYIGIGTPIAERPSHTTGHTGHVSGDSAGLTDTDKTMGLLGLGERNATGISASAAQYW
jgi:hypothetical protein